VGKRILTYFNIAVAIVLALAFAGLYWYVFRPLPKSSGTLRAPLSFKAAIARDRLGMPHIEAGSIEDALFLQGFVTAQDRLWQMDGLRRAAGGRLAQILGPAFVESDRQARRFRMQRLAEEHTARLSPAERAALAAYARGVNYFIETHRGQYPVEFTLIGYDPEPWRISDSALIGLYMFRDLTTTWEFDVQKQDMMAGGDPAKVNYLFQGHAGGEARPGSNAWVLAGSRTATGKPVLANDMHLEFSMPSIWYMVHLTAPELNVSGVSLPGVPCVMVGHNDRVAWGITNLQADVQDLYIEKFDPRTGRYLYKGQMEQARLEREMIPVRNGTPVEMVQWITRHGPVMIAEGNRFLALRWTAAEPDGFSLPFLQLDRSRNWEEFNAALERITGPGLNFVYADRDGNIGYHVAGKLPVRRNFNGDVPVDGSSGEFEWDGYIPFEQLPKVYNPPSGMIVTANQNPFPPNYQYRINGNFAPRYRSNQIRDLLSVRRGWHAANMLTVQKDVYSPWLHFLGKQLVAAYDRHGSSTPEFASAVSTLRSWNGQMEAHLSAPLIATLHYQHLRTAVAERASPGKGLVYSFTMAPPRLEQLLRDRPKDWFGDYDQLLLRTFVDAVEEGRRIQGRKIEAWDYGRYIELTLAHPIGSRLPWVSKYFNIGPVEQSGSPSSVKQTTPKLGPSMRMGVDLADFDNSYLNIATGESGQVLSSHYKDQWDAYYYGKSFPMQFGKVEAKSTLLFEPGE
jgi:penicillin G amidase